MRLTNNAPESPGLFLLLTKNRRKSDYKSMRVITDELYAQLVKMLAQDEKVAIFQKLLLSQKAEPADTPDQVKSEGK